MSILQLQRRIQEAGRIRIGQQVQMSNGKSRPAKLETFRLTSQDRRRIDQAAGMYGGRPQEWTSPSGVQWEVITETAELDVIVPPSEMSFSQHYELWSGGGCQRRCDGVTEQLTDGPCICDPDDRECKPHTRLSVMLRDLPGLGVWRIDTQGWYAATELEGVVQVIAAAAGAGTLLPARLRLEQRQVRRPGQPTRNFAVPVLDIEVTPAQLLGGQGGGMQLGGISGTALPAGESERPALMSPVPPTVTERPAASVAAQAAVVESPPEGTRRKNAAQPLPATGLAPRTAAEAGAGGAPSEDVSKLKKAQLVKRLHDAGLDSDGKVDELRARWREHLAGTVSEAPGSSSSGVGAPDTREPGAAGVPPDPPPDDEPRPFDRDGAQKAFHAQLHELGLDYETQVRPWMQQQYQATLSKLDDGRLRKLLDAMDLRPMEFVVAVQEHAETNEPGEEPAPSLAERAHAHAEGQSDAVAGYQARIREAWRVLAVANETVYQGGWERAEKITGGRAGSSDWSGSSEAALRALAVDMERAAAEAGGEL